MAFATTLRHQVIDPFRENASLLMVCVATVMIMLGQGVISPVLPLYAKDFGVGATMVGATISVFGLARMLLNLPAGFLSDRYGYRLLLVGGPAITAIGSLLCAVAGDIWQLLAFRFVAGAGSALFMTGALILVTDISTPENRGRMLSLQLGSLLLGVSIGPAVGGLTAQFFGLRAPFVVVGLLAAACTVWAMRRIPQSQRASSTSVDHAADETPTAAASTALRSLFLNPGFILISLVSFSIFFTRTGSRQTVLALMGSERLGLSAGALGGIFAMMALLNLIAIGPSGAWADRFGRKRVIVPSLCIMVVALGLFAMTGGLWLFLVAAVLQGIGTGLGGPAPAAYAADVIPSGARGVGMGLFRTYSDIGFVAGPLLLGWIADATGSFGWALWLNAALLAACALLFGLFARETVERQSGPASPPTTETAGLEQ
ncbi:MAG: MFS transporter [Chloroflexi bacterium]|nr:MFS transporter [Chloroflexota bacterium]